jgi:ABC-type branched-subunit amino acid transport system ATPase component
MKLEVDSVSKEFAGLRALTDVSLELREEEILAVIGPNGSGKTTLINVISGVIPPTAGEVRMGTSTLTKLRSHNVARAGIARTFQNIRLFGDLTVLENIEAAAAVSPRTKGWLRRRAVSVAALEMLGLSRLADEVVGTLAYGVQRRVEIARAVATRPRFLLLDEPAAGLNEVESDELLAVIRSVREEYGVGILLIDHDLRLIMRVAERIHVLNEGHTLAHGSPDEIRRNPAVIEAYLGSEEEHRHLKEEAPNAADGSAG